ncbi:cytosolic protein [Aquibacillus salsiterrae]|uniref:Cytosolic protein n=1 Tax=Aquibacillus salsiterrae TaxID=2950439 RepID=A0A9X4AF03_9BACI|nr:cytosolic protein [Aquibacillus salsiterrae]MDC3415735.1 cytosolic protein [Aquibacillus salsiterrae]
MSIQQTFNKYFNNHSETSDKHWDPKLKTHYFKTTKDKGFKAVEDYFRNSASFEVVAVSEERGEISANYKKGKKAFVIVTIIMVRPFRTAVDFSVTTESAIPFDLGYSHKLIPKFYEELKKELPLVDAPKGS